MPRFEELSPRAKKHAIEKFQQYEREDFDPRILNDLFKERLEEVGLPSDDIRWSLNYTQGDGVAFYGQIDIKDYLAKNKDARTLALPLFAPGHQEKEESPDVGAAQRRQAEAMVAAFRKLAGYEASIREARDCYLVDVFEERGWMATFCVGAGRSSSGKGRKSQVSIEDESEPGTGSFLFNRAGLDKRLFESQGGGTPVPIDDLVFQISKKGYGNYDHWNTMEVELSESSLYRFSLTKGQERDLDRLLEHIEEHAKQMSKTLEKLGYDDMDWQTSEENISEMLTEGDHEFDEDGNLA
jgi:hypothetical protein